MDGTGIIVTLSLVTLLGVCVIALIGKNQTEQRLADDDAPKSTLAADKASDGKPIDV